MICGEIVIFIIFHLYTTQVYFKNIKIINSKEKKFNYYMLPEDKDKKILAFEDKKRVISEPQTNKNLLNKDKLKKKPNSTGKIPTVDTYDIKPPQSTDLTTNQQNFTNNKSKKHPAFEDSTVLIIEEEKEPVQIFKDEKKQAREQRRELGEMFGEPLGYKDFQFFNENYKENDQDNTDTDFKIIDFIDLDGFFISSNAEASDSEVSDGGESGYEADSEGDEITPAVIPVEVIVPPVLSYTYDLVLEKKKQFLYSNILASGTNFVMLNYINYLFYKKDWLLLYPDSIRFKLAVRKYRFRLNKYKNRLYYSKKVKFDISGTRAVVQLTSRYRNKFFTFLRKSLHFNLSVGRVFF
jgi:hypothetical protein